MRKNALAWISCLFASLFFFYAFMLMNIFNAISIQISNTLHINGHQLGLLSSSYLFANVIFLIPAGIIVDKFSVRKILVTVMIAAAIFTFLFSQIKNLEMGIIINFLLGISATFSFLAPVKLAKQWFLNEKIVLVTGAILSFSMLGGIIANTAFVALAQKYGWQNVFIILSGVAVIFSILKWLFIVDYSSKKVKKQVYYKTYKVHLKVVMAGTYNSLLNLVLPVLGAEWGILYLEKVFTIQSYQAGIILSMLFLGITIGSLLAGWVSVHLIEKSKLMILSAALSLVCIIVLQTNFHLNFYELIILFLFLGLLSGTQTVGYAIVVETSKIGNTAFNMGLISTIVMLGGAIMQPIFGLILDHNAISVSKINFENFTINGFNYAMQVFVFAYILSLIIGMYFYFNNISKINITR